MQGALQEAKLEDQSSRLTQAEGRGHHSVCGDHEARGVHSYVWKVGQPGCRHQESDSAASRTHHATIAGEVSTIHSLRVTVGGWVAWQAGSVHSCSWEWFLHGASIRYELAVWERIIMPSLHRQAAVCALGACTGWCHSDVDMNGKCVGWGATVSMCMQSSRRLKARCILLRGFTLGSKHLPQMMMMMMMVWGLMFSDEGLTY